MKKINIKRIASAFILSILVGVSLVSSANAATCVDKDGQTVTTSVIACPNTGNGIVWDVLNLAINFLAVGVGLAIVVGIVFGAFTYASAGGSADQAKKGISYITNAVIGLLLFIFMYAIINFLVPGGLF